MWSTEERAVAWVATYQYNPVEKRVIDWATFLGTSWLRNSEIPPGEVCRPKTRARVGVNNTEATVTKVRNMAFYYCTEV